MGAIGEQVASKRSKRATCSNNHELNVPSLTCMKQVMPFFLEYVLVGPSLSEPHLVELLDEMSVYLSVHTYVPYVMP